MQQFISFTTHVYRRMDNTVSDYWLVISSLDLREICKMKEHWNLLTFLNSELSQSSEAHQATDSVSQETSQSDRALVVVPVVRAQTWHGRVVQPVPEVVHCLNLYNAKHCMQFNTEISR